MAGNHKEQGFWQMAAAKPKKNDFAFFAETLYQTDFYRCGL
jgi:hypothetical protein